MLMCALFVSNTSDIAFNRSDGANTARSQSAMDIDQYFKSQLFFLEPGLPKAGAHFTDWAQ